MNFMKNILLVALLVLAVNGFAADYGKKEKFAKGKALVFSDVELTYLGTRVVKTPKFPPGFTYYDFKVTKGAESKTVSWSSGTGLIDWADFEIGGKKFMLELKGSRAFKGWMKDDELVLWTEAAFKKMNESR